MSKNVIKRLVFLLVFCTALSAGWTTYAKSDTTIQHLMSGTQGMFNVVQDAIADYAKIRPDVKVEFSSIANQTDADNKFLLAVAGGVPIDVIRTNPEFNLHGFAKAGLIQPLDDLAKKVGLNLEEFYPAALDIARVDGKLYAIPYTVVPIAGLFYRTDIFAAAGVAPPNASWSWENEFVAAARKLVVRDADGVITRFGAGFAPHNIRAGWGASPLTADNTQSNALSPENIRFLRFLQEAVQLGLVGPGGAESNLINGKIAMAVGGYWFKETLNAGGIGDRYAVAPIPQGPKGRIVEWVIGAHSIPTNSSNPEEALRYIMHLTSPKWTTAWVRAGLNPASRHAVNMLPEFRKDPVHQAWSEFFTYPAGQIYWPPNLRFTEVRQAFESAMNDVMYRNVPVEIALENMDTKVRAILAEPPISYSR
jgi:multiple sugar transport system substrate-binding protein